MVVKFKRYTFLFIRDKPFEFAKYLHYQEKDFHHYAMVINWVFPPQKGTPKQKVRQ